MSKTFPSLTPKQKENLLSFMESHLAFAKGQITGLGNQGAQASKNLWEKLSLTLNSLGKYKSIESWKNVCNIIYLFISITFLFF